MTIRIATEEDWPRIVEIYNQAIELRTSTADTEPVTLESKRSWLQGRDSTKHPIYVREAEEGVVGWCSLSPYRFGRPAFERTVEISYYVDRERRREGVASGLIEHAFGECPDLGIDSLVAILLASNVASIAALERFGFSEWGRPPGIALIDGERYDHVYMGKRVSGSAGPTN